MGKIYYSPFVSLNLMIRPQRKLYEAGVEVGEVRELLAEFGMHRGEYTYLDGNGNEQVASDISGHYFDLDAQAEDKEWDEEEKALAEKRLDWFCQRYPDQVRLHVQPKADRPWPKYDETDPDGIATIAVATGSVLGALVYERENAKRKKVIDALEAALALEQAEADAEVDDSELVAA